MLPRVNRIRRTAEFNQAMRKGRRANEEALAVAYVRSAPDTLMGEPPQPRVGFVVSKAVGGAVVRNRVRRRLRELSRDRLALLPPGSLLVVRAKPAAATYSYHKLAGQLDSALASVLRPRSGGKRRRGHGGGQVERGDAAAGGDLAYS